MKQYIVDAFTDQLFCGNQAAVCVVDEWPTDRLMQDIAKENRFSETAFVVREQQGWHLRWFTPGGEIDFCGHATLGTAFVLFRFYCPDAASIAFDTQVGRCSVERQGDLYVMDFPSYACTAVPVTDAMEAAIGVRPKEAYLDRDLMLVLPSEKDVRELHPDQGRLKELDGLLVAVTARGEKYDCVSRVFAPKLAIDEDPVTGSTHCMIAPYWCARLGKTELSCYQASERGGELRATLADGRVKIAGKAVLFAEAELSV
ncbi:PhzF family phenazine biosynthesis protein [Olsenella sp. YH-ols2221]|jgi:PhzF family phenazine biosynthesis protein|uniref:PhzF family phenazine biosynthesis protein n=1 Tax=Olsenella kribbiana TaxID=3115221 RepID=UPI002A8903AA|nr:PhzF family phenazine biosynthesis protein [Atopobiaceae bacterium]MCI1540314.1 PhzF family phenazine biosynthesis protein [Atopobiaceae bacterium]MDD5843828.1 PhzF family phenazine biosynthesis protein [Olsenella sp.]MDY3970281.1 PhzF family phenazine biosynthesis protein [Atopobiaceae bacterium]MDY5275617.1 PhzF family phenazine biosynthesis protein [Atopobiaceae bacterium]